MPARKLNLRLSDAAFVALEAACADDLPRRAYIEALLVRDAHALAEAAGTLRAFSPALRATLASGLLSDPYPRVRGYGDYEAFLKPLHRAVADGHAGVLDELASLALGGEP